MVKIGQLCVKIAGRDSGKECLIVDKLEGSFVMIDGLTRRRKCNIKHLEILPKEAKIQKGVSHDEVITALKTLGINVKEKKKVKTAKAPKAVKKTEKKKKERKTEAKKTTAKKTKKIARKKTKQEKKAKKKQKAKRTKKKR